MGDMLTGVRARSAAFCRVAMAPPWALRIADESPLALAAPLNGDAWIVTEGESLHVPDGSVALVRGATPYTVASAPDARHAIVVGPDNALFSPDGAPLHEDDARLLLASSPDATTLVSGSYRVPGDVGRRLLEALPRALVVAPQPGMVGLSLLASEVGLEAPGQRVMLDRLLDVALIETLRAWFDRQASQAPGWYAAGLDPVVGPAVKAIHRDPARPWSVASLAAEAGVSRATLARRFRAVVGEAPMAYLATWRMTLAADLLRGTSLSLDAIARRVGYADGFSLSSTFTRLRGVRPSEHRGGARQAALVTAPAGPPR